MKVKMSWVVWHCPWMLPQSLSCVEMLTFEFQSKEGFSRKETPTSNDFEGQFGVGELRFFRFLGKTVVYPLKNQPLRSFAKNWF